VLEDESPNIGRCHVPDDFYARMATAPMVRIEMPVRERALAIYREYVQMPLAEGIKAEMLEPRFSMNVERIRNKLGGLECDRIKKGLARAFAADTQHADSLELHLDWIERLLSVYYDKQYLYSLALKSRQTLFRGGWEACRDFLRELQHAS
jgi:tRNA 2-selenouridine synthase